MLQDFKACLTILGCDALGSRFAEQKIVSRVCFVGSVYGIFD